MEMPNNTIFCQSCAMPLNNPEDFGKEKDGTKCSEYCHYCYENGTFTSEQTMEQAIESCIPFEIEAGNYQNAEDARKGMMEYYPKLKRWAN